MLSGAKSDAGDAAVIAEYLRLRRHRLRVAVPYSGQTQALRTVVRTRSDLAGMRVAATNQLSALLETSWPGAQAIFADVESPISLAFLTRYPTPASAAHLGEKRIAAFCASQGYSGKRPAAELLARLRSAPAGTADPALTTALGTAVLALVAVLRALNTAVKDLDRSATARLGEHPDGEIFTSLPRSGQINAAQMLAEWGDCRQAYDGPDAVAALAGCTPVTRESGKHRAALPLGLQQALPQGDDHLRRQQPARQPLGRENLQRRPRRRQRPPPRRTHPRPRLDPRDLALLAQPHALRPRQARRGRSPRRTNCCMRLTQGVSRVLPEQDPAVWGIPLRAS